MKEIYSYKTKDGEVFEDIGKAKAYLEKKYSDLLVTLAHKIISFETKPLKHTTEYIDANLKEFLELKKLKDDLIIEFLEEKIK